MRFALGKGPARAFLLTLLSFGLLYFTLPAAQAEDPAQDFTHAVFAEDFTATWCYNCPTADEQLKDLYDNGGYGTKFYHVAMIFDVNDKANERKNDLGIRGQPTVYFDNGHKIEQGAKSSSTVYENAIASSGERSVLYIYLNVAMEYLGNATVNVTVTVNWTGGEPHEGTTFNGYLRAYIVEPISRYDNNDGDPYGAGFLDFAFEQAVELTKDQPLELTTTWNGGEHQDKRGDDFSDLDYQNLNVIAAIFDNEQGNDEYVHQVAAAIPPVLEVEHLASPLWGQVNITGMASGEHTSIVTLEQRVDEGPWQPIELEQDFQFSLDTTLLTNRTHLLQVKATDETGTSTTKELSLNVQNDGTGPMLQILEPQFNHALSDNISIVVESRDPQGVVLVSYSLDGGPWLPLSHGIDDKFTLLMNTRTLSDGTHQLILQAFDTQDNLRELTVNLTVNNSGAPTLPWLALLTPKTGQTPLKGVVEILAYATDPEGIALVEYSLDEGQTFVPLTPAGANNYSALWNTTHLEYHRVNLSLRAHDTGSFVSTLVVNLTIYNRMPPNQAPQASIIKASPNPLELGQVLKIAGHGQDPDGAVMNYRWTWDGLEISTLDSFNFTPPVSGSFLLGFSVQDDSGTWSDPAELTITVEEPTGGSKDEDSLPGPGLALLIPLLLLGLHFRRFRTDSNE